MSDVAIRVENISKRYKIGARVDRHATLRDQLAGALAAPGRALVRAARRDAAPERADQTEFWALKDVSFEVKQGEVMGVIGRNGAGKSTLLKILSRITKPTSGRVELRGRVGSLLEVGTGFHPELTGRENIYLNGAILGMHQPEIDRKFDEIVAFAEVEAFLDTPVKRYSSGMYVRLAFAVAAHLPTEILLVDEVLAVGDAAFQKKCLSKIGELARQDRTVVFVSHNMVSTEALASAAILLEAGEVGCYGEVPQVIGRYLEGGIQPLSQYRFADALRSGGGQVRITSLEFSNTAGEPSALIPMGEPLRATLTLETLSGPALSPRRYISVQVGVYDGLMRPVCHLSSINSGTDLFTEGGHKVTQISVTTSILNLLPGRYSLNLAVLDGAGRELFDHLLHCAQFEVIEVDVFATGRIPHQQGGVCYFSSTWATSAEK